MNKCVAIIGAGPAGIATSVQLKRLGISIILFEQNNNNLGSLLRNAWKVENYLGISPISGIELLQKLTVSLNKVNIKPIYEKVESLDYDINLECFKIITAKNTYFVNHVVVASGTLPKISTLIEKQSNNIKARIFYEVYPLLKLKKNQQNILIIGGGDAAFDNALNLTQNHHNVIICWRHKLAKAAPLLIKQTEKQNNITCYSNCELQSMLQTNVSILKITLFDKANNNNIFLDVNYVIMAIGRKPNKSFYTKNLTLLEQRLIAAQKLFLVGDVLNNLYRQASIATGDGIKTAMKIFYAKNYQ